MAGTLITSTIQGTTLTDGTNSTSTTNCIQGSAKAWVNFNASSGSVVINASYNVSSVTRASISNYTINYTNAFADTKYVWSGSSGLNNQNQSGWIAGPLNVALATWKTTTSTNIIFTYQNSLVMTFEPADVSFIATR